MTELKLTRVPNDRRLYRLDGIGTVRLEGWFGRSGSAKTEDGRSWRFCRRGLWQRLIQATDVSGALAGEFTPRDLRRGGALRWGTRELKLKPLGMRERYALTENEQELARFDAKGWGKRPVKITLTVDRDEIQAELLLFAAFIVHQLAGDANTAASTAATVASSGSYSVLLLVTALAATASAAQPRAADAAPSHRAACSASHLSATLPSRSFRQPSQRPADESQRPPSPATSPSSNRSAKNIAASASPSVARSLRPRSGTRKRPAVPNRSQHSSRFSASQ
jgi:hypothetical protein